MGQNGFDIERTPEDWLFKAYFDGVLVDVLHRINGVPVDSVLLAGAVVRDVLAISMPVAALVSTLSPRFAGGYQSLMDFNPMVNALRLIGSNDQNFAVVSVLAKAKDDGEEGGEEGATAAAE